MFTQNPATLKATTQRHFTGIAQVPQENVFVVMMDMMKLRMALTVGDKDADENVKLFTENNEDILQFSSSEFTQFTDGFFVDLGHKIDEMLIR